MGGQRKPQAHACRSSAARIANPEQAYAGSTSFRHLRRASTESTSWASRIRSASPTKRNLCPSPSKFHGRASTRLLGRSRRGRTHNTATTDNSHHQEAAKARAPHPLHQPRQIPLNLPPPPAQIDRADPDRPARQLEPVVEIATSRRIQQPPLGLGFIRRPPPQASSSRRRRSGRGCASELAFHRTACPAASCRTWCRR